MSYSYTVLNNSTNDMNLNGLEYYEFFFIDASNSDMSIILPAGFDSQFFQFQRIDQTSNIVTFYTNSQNENINGNTSLIFPINRYSQVIKYGDSWIMPLIAFN